MVNVIESEDVVACRVGNRIYIHPELKDYPLLRKAILKHEHKHTSGFKKSDFWLDFRNKELKGHKKDFWKFVFTHPRTLKTYFFISKFDGKWVIDPTMFLINLLALCVLWGLVRFL